MANVIVDIKDVNKIYGTNHVVKDLNLQVEEGEFLTLLGSSGCGKTTTLRMIAGFEEPTTGSIQVEGEPIEDKEPFERNVNTVFQSYALFPHKTIYDNVAYGLKMKKVPKKEIKERVTEMLEMVQLSGFEKRYPSQLSGGQKQRVAIARALINRPKVLLLDEPLGALDLKLRKQMQLELKRLQKKLHITFIYVTHDQEEALTMSDRIGWICKVDMYKISDGRCHLIHQTARLSEVYIFCILADDRDLDCRYGTIIIKSRQDGSDDCFECCICRITHDSFFYCVGRAELSGGSGWSFYVYRSDGRKHYNEDDIVECERNSRMCWKEFYGFL